MLNSIKKDLFPREYEGEKRSILLEISFLLLFQFILIAGIYTLENYFVFFPLYLIIPFFLFMVFKNPSITLYTYILLLPLQYFLMMVLFGVFKVSSSAITIISAWKEIFIIVVFISIFFELLMGKKRVFKATSVDVLMILFLIYGIIHMILPESFFGIESNFKLKLYGFKALFLFIFLYFAGRFVRLSKKNIRLVYITAIIVGVLTAIIGIAELALSNEEIFIKLGYLDYTENYLGLKYTGKFGLAENLWRDLGGIQVRRAISVYLSSQPFAQSFLLIIPLTIGLFLSKKRGRKIFLKLAIGLFMIALILTITRAVIVLCIFQIALIGIIMKKKKIAIGVTAIFLVLILLFLISTPSSPTFLENTIALEDESGKGHVEKWERNIKLIKRYYFFGMGLGMGGEASERVLGDEIGVEGEYFVFITELGLIGLALYLSIFILILKKGFRAYSKAEDDLTKNFILSVLLCGIGIALLSIVSHTRGAIFVYYIYWWLSGYVVTVYSESS